MEEGGGGPAKVIKNLAACNQTIRHRALKLLIKTWLPTQQKVSQDDMKKIWKGLFYCLWHADKSQLQSDIINSLSSLLLSLPLPLSIHYFSSFLLTIHREWPGIDSLRLDKFYLLIRRFMHHFFCLMKKNSWDLELVKKLVPVLEERGILVKDEGNKFVSNGVNYHIATVFLDELKPFWPIRVEVFDVLFRPFVGVLLKSNDKVLVSKVKINVFDVLLENGRRFLEVKGLGDEVSDGDEVAVFGTIGLKLGLSSKFFEAGSCDECVQGNRKVLFGLHDDFLKLEKSLEKSGIVIEIPEVKDDEKDEVPSLVPMNVDGSDIGPECVEEVCKEVVNGSEDDSKGPKKSKKGKKGSESNEKKSKKKKKVKSAVVVESAPMVEDEGALSAVNSEDLKDDPPSDSGSLTFNETVIANLQMQFEKVAAEAGLSEDCAGLFDSLEPKANGVIKKKRKRAKSVDRKNSNNLEGDDTAKTGEKSEKKVRFSMKNNLVWKPDSPLPDQRLRIPPSVTPRGSALKAGVPPGPIRGLPNANKKVKRASAMKKKSPKTIKGIKQIKKIKVMSI